ncbi:Ubiquitin-conjugating enzyme E2 L3 [Cadophora gregata]|uniref:Ubiquitin-conjugating enzyme E2 L3 n=1 Tax=Cadophora gregata TaxID=51156 RepID=UPI0026DA8EB9|nr:Ubiquitin-conjugating enzyme E2 L3 [Cadophora gregata]KAK0100189.1 Ubiquitin-conjugating enzyme E2 L3 [Cadophora gregata]KAK0114864.1 Ubiquitin-conjugating enzyme E2 L3 [Cadophora gregata f. sp. sojae]
MGSSQKRITKELAEVTESPPAGIKVSLADEANVHTWNIIMDGPEGSPYAGGKFHLLLTLPHEYPFKPPKISFKTRIWHPNVTFDEHGSMCIGILKADAWKPSSKIMSVLTATQQLMMEPVPDDAVEQSAAQKFKEDRKTFDKEAREWTKKYAMGK